MPYCITLRSRTNAMITGWYAGGNGGWSTDHKRQKLFGNKSGPEPFATNCVASARVNVRVINIEVAEDDPSSEGVPPTFETMA